MKLKAFVLCLLPLASLLPLVSANKPAFAGCALVDVGVQVSARGSRIPSQQTNNVNQQAGENCIGNTVTSVGTQVYTGPGSVRQTRNSNQYTSGTENTNIGVKTPTVKVPVGVKVDVYNPAADPNFMPGVIP